MARLREMAVHLVPTTSIVEDTRESIRAVSLPVARGCPEQATLPHYPSVAADGV